MTFIWPECMERTKREHGAGISCKGYGQLLAERDALAARLAEAERLLERALRESARVHPDFMGQIQAFLRASDSASGDSSA